MPKVRSVLQLEAARGRLWPHSRRAGQRQCRSRRLDEQATIHGALFSFLEKK